MQTGEIEIVVPVSDSADVRHALPSPLRVSKLIRLGGDELASALMEQIRPLAAVFAELDLGDAGCVVDEMRFSLQISAEGKVQMIGSLAAGTQAGLTITLRREGNRSP